MPLGLDTIFLLGGVVAEAGLIALLVGKRVFRGFPVFCSYMVWSLFVDLLVYILRALSPANYFWVYVPEMIVDSMFQFAVLVELEWSVLRPVRTLLPRRSILVLALLITLLGALIWPFSGWILPADLGTGGRFYVHMQQTFAILRVAIFLLLAGFSQMLSIGWKNRELQIATGLGFYSLVSLAVAMVHAHQAMDAPQYAYLDQVVTASYLCSLLYWVLSFAQQEAERREFTPQMQTFLLAVAGAAKTARLELTDSAETAKKRKPGEE
jgi:hypothetical protein